MRILDFKECKICGEEVKHLKCHLKVHNVSDLEYYNKYESRDGGLNICLNDGCTNSTTFISLFKGSRLYCSNSCARTGKPTVLTKEVRARGDKTRFLNNCLRNNISLGIIYLMEIDNNIKIGICAYDEDRIYLKYRISYLKPKNLILYKGLVDIVSDIELDVKIKYDSIKGTEYFSIDNKLSLESLLENNINLSRIELHKVVELIEV